MFNFLARVNWNAASEVLMRGNPPLIVQLLALNSIVFIIFVVRRMRSKGPKKATGAHLAQAVFIVANIALLSQEQLRPYFQDRIMSMWHSVDRMITNTYQS
jgi:hypothetical protein